MQACFKVRKSPLLPPSWSSQQRFETALRRRWPRLNVAIPCDKIHRPQSEAAKAEIVAQRWTFITNHGLVLSCIYHNPSHTAREISNHVGITERTTHKIISDLEAAGYIERRKSGRRNLYLVDPQLPLRHHTKQDILVEDLLDALTYRRTEELTASDESVAV